MSCACQAPPAGPDPGADTACAGEEAFALRVLGVDMQPEFDPGDIVIIEPGGALADGRYVLAHQQDEWLLRQLVRHGDRWWLRALNPAPDEAADRCLGDLLSVRGVVIQKAVPGRRRASRFYV